MRVNLQNSCWTVTSKFIFFSLIVCRVKYEASCPNYYCVLSGNKGFESFLFLASSIIYVMYFTKYTHTCRNKNFWGGGRVWKTFPWDFWEGVDLGICFKPQGLGGFKFENLGTWPNYLEKYSRIIANLLYSNEIQIHWEFFSKIHQMALAMV